VWAAGAFAATLALLLPPSLQAVDPTPGGVTTPALTVNGVSLSIRPLSPTTRPGPAPVIELVAANPTAAPVGLTYEVELLATAPSSPMSRVMVMPRSLYRTPPAENRLVLEGGQTRTIAIASGATLAQGEIQVIVRSGGNQIMAGQFSVSALAGAVADGKPVVAAERPLQAQP
jgi:hypothetical protein